MHCKFISPLWYSQLYPLWCFNNYYYFNATSLDYFSCIVDSSRTFDLDYKRFCLLWLLFKHFRHSFSIFHFSPFYFFYLCHSFSLLLHLAFSIHIYSEKERKARFEIRQRLIHVLSCVHILKHILQWCFIHNCLLEMIKREEDEKLSQ